MSEETKQGQLTAVQDFLAQRKAALANVLPAHMDEGRFTRMVVNACLRNQKLLEADRGSLFLAVMALGEMGLEPSVGQGALVPYRDGKSGKTFVQAQPMYQGLLKLAHNAGFASMIYAEAVYAGDQFDYELGLEPRLVHKPTGQGGELTHAYCVVHYRDGGRYFVVMTRAEIDKIRARAKAKSGPWDTDYAEMAKKTVLKRALKMVPRSFELSAALTADNRAERGGSALPLGAAIPDDLLASVMEPEEDAVLPKQEPWNPAAADEAGKAEVKKALADAKLGTTKAPGLTLEGKP